MKKYGGPHHLDNDKAKLRESAATYALVAIRVLNRLEAWFEERPLAKTRVSRFAKLAPLAT